MYKNGHTRTRKYSNSTHWPANVHTYLYILIAILQSPFRVSIFAADERRAKPISPEEMLDHSSARRSSLVHLMLHSLCNSTKSLLSIQNHFKIISKSFQNQFKIGFNQFKINSKSIQNQLKIS